MKCTYCDKENEKDKIFCFKCGNELLFRKKHVPDKISNSCNHEWKRIDPGYSGTTFICIKCGIED